MFPEIKLKCPVCGEELEEAGKSLSCPRRHCFDKARQGYVNLLPVQNKHSLSPGDAADMLSARRQFLHRDHYMPICTAAAEAIRKYAPSSHPVIADIGCGEGYYTARFRKLCQGICIGVDISKEAAKMACRESHDILWLVATAAKLPIADHSVDCVTAVFSLFVNDEYARILRSGGIVVEVTAGSGHLYQLKELIYDQVYEQHKAPAPFGEQFEQLSLDELKFDLSLTHPELTELLAMTPHSRRMKRDKAASIEQVEQLTVTVDCLIRVLRKK